MKLHHLAAVAALAVSSAQAAQESTTMNVLSSNTVQATCTRYNIM